MGAVPVALLDEIDEPERIVGAGDRAAFRVERDLAPDAVVAEPLAGSGTQRDPAGTCPLSGPNTTRSQRRLSAFATHVSPAAASSTV